MVGNPTVGARERFHRGAARALLLVTGLGLAFACGGQSVEEVTDEGPDCIELCEKGKQEGCRGTDTLMCEDSCLSEDFRVERTRCRPEYEAMRECTAELDDVCRVVIDCRSQYQTLCDCYWEYCEDHPTEDICIGICGF
jgi:hypothetical protein